MINQKRLKIKGADLYTVAYQVEVEDELITNEVQIYSESDELAQELGEKIQFRIQEKNKEGRTLLQRLDISPKDLWDNKLGILLPWKDPIYKRSLHRGSRLPALRFRAQFNNLRSVTFKNPSSLNISDHSKDDIDALIQKCIIGYFCTAIIFVIFLFCLFNAFQSNSNNIGVFIIAGAFCFISGGLQIHKIIYNHTLLNKRRKALNGK